MCAPSYKKYYVFTLRHAIEKFDENIKMVKNSPSIFGLIDKEYMRVI